MKKQTYTQSLRALGGTVEFAIVMDDPKLASYLQTEIIQYIFKFEKNFSRFLPNSELSIFNRRAGKAQKVSTNFANILGTAKRLAMQTNGLYNPFILPALQKVGYKQSLMKGYENDTYEDYSKRKVVGFEELEIDDTIAKIPEQTAIDLGGIGKGYLAEQLAMLYGSQTQGYWFSIGGDIAIGGLDDNDRPWQVAIESVRGGHAGRIELGSKDTGIATSGTTKRRGKNGTTSWHHIIDTRTNLPATSDIATITVVHPSPTSADVLASCALVLGSSGASDFLDSNGAKQWVIQTANGQIIQSLHKGYKMKVSP